MAFGKQVNKDSPFSQLFSKVQLYTAPPYQESVAGSVIQATGKVEFEDGLWIGNHLKAQNSLQRVHTIPWVRPGVVCTQGFLRGQMNSNQTWSAWLLGVQPFTRFDSWQPQC